MSRFASKKLQTIDLGDGEWVKIPTALSYAEVLELTSAKTEMEMSKTMLVRCIREWNIKDEDGKFPELNEENILNLDVQTITLISQEITKLMTNNQDKKKLQESSTPVTESNEIK